MFHVKRGNLVATRCDWWVPVSAPRRRDALPRLDRGPPGRENHPLRGPRWSAEFELRSVGPPVEGVFHVKLAATPSPTRAVQDSPSQEGVTTFRHARDLATSPAPTIAEGTHSPEPDDADPLPLRGGQATRSRCPPYGPSSVDTDYLRGPGTLRRASGSPALITPHCAPPGKTVAPGARPIAPDARPSAARRRGGVAVSSTRRSLTIERGVGVGDHTGRDPTPLPSVRIGSLRGRPGNRVRSETHRRPCWSR